MNSLFKRDFLHLSSSPSSSVKKVRVKKTFSESVVRTGINLGKTVTSFIERLQFFVIDCVTVKASKCLYRSFGQFAVS